MPLTLVDRHHIPKQLRQAHVRGLDEVAHLGGKRPTDCHGEHVAVRTRPGTARHVALCAAFGRRMGSSLALVLLAALSRHLGGLAGLFPLYRQHKRLDFLGLCERSHKPTYASYLFMLR